MRIIETKDIIPALKIDFKLSESQDDGPIVATTLVLLMFGVTGSCPKDSLCNIGISRSSSNARNSRCQFYSAVTLTLFITIEVSTLTLITSLNPH